MSDRPRSRLRAARRARPTADRLPGRASDDAPGSWGPASPPRRVARMFGTSAERRDPIRIALPAWLLLVVTRWHTKDARAAPPGGARPRHGTDRNPPCPRLHGRHGKSGPSSGPGFGSCRPFIVARAVALAATLIEIDADIGHAPFAAWSRLFFGAGEEGSRGMLVAIATSPSNRFAGGERRGAVALGAQCSAGPPIRRSRSRRGEAL